MSETLKTQRPKIRPMTPPASKALDDAPRALTGSVRKAQSGDERRWIADLAEPYLRGYVMRESVEEGLTGYWFDAPRSVGEHESKNHDNEEQHAPRGFFVGYLEDAKKYEHLTAKVPECLAFVWFSEPREEEHARLVASPGSLLRKTHTYIGWLTHRLPRFELYMDQFIALVRHRTMLDWPEDKREHYSRNFFIETLAWLVRSGLVKGLKNGEGIRLEVQGNEGIFP